MSPVPAVMTASTTRVINLICDSDTCCADLSFCSPLPLAWLVEVSPVLVTLHLLLPLIIICSSLMYIETGLQPIGAVFVMSLQKYPILLWS
jgi:hypothetical protein